MKLFISVLALTFGFAMPAKANNMFYKTKFSTYALQTEERIKSTKLLYYGGPVIAKVKVYSVFWGAKIDSKIQSGIGAFYETIVDSKQMDFLNQYNTTNLTAVDGRKGTNQTISRGAYGGTFLINPANTNTKLDDLDIRAELEAQITAHVLPAPDENSLYMIYFPPGASITVEGQTSCSSFCAYHNGYASSKFGSVYYGVMPDLKSGGCAFGCGFGQDAFNITTIVSSHEFIEAVTDPFPTPGDKPAYPQAWNTSNGEEIGDLCGGSSGTVGKYSIQGEWDNATESCVAGPY